MGKVNRFFFWFSVFRNKGHTHHSPPRWMYALYCPRMNSRYMILMLSLLDSMQHVCCIILAYFAKEVLRCVRNVLHCLQDDRKVVSSRANARDLTVQEYDGLLRNAQRKSEFLWGCFAKKSHTLSLSDSLLHSEWQSGNNSSRCSE